MPSSPVLRLDVDPMEYGVLRLPPDTPLPAWVGGDFFSITRTPQELSIVVTASIYDAAVVPPETPYEGGWRALHVRGPLPFDAIGILARLSHVLAEACISIFVLSTYDTDILLLKAEQLPEAVRRLEERGYQVFQQYR